MLGRLKQLLKDEPREQPADDHRLAAAVLLYEIAHADFEHQPAERRVLRDELRNEFDLAPEILEPLLADAAKQQREAISLHDFVQTLNRNMTPDDKATLVRMLWRVAYADGKLDPHEEHRLRRIADLLHVRHEDFIRGKLAASGEAGG